MKGFNLVGIDKEFDYLEEASFDFQIPENISNFSNLKRLNLEDFDDRIGIREGFLEDLINLEELVLDGVVGFIDPNAQYLFKKLTKLKEIKLNSVNFENLKSTYFGYLVNLEKLDLSYCFLKSVEASPFRNLKKLNYLNLSNCEADKPLDRLIFVGMLNLNTLDIKFDPDGISAQSIEFKKDSFTDLKNLSNFIFRK